MSLSKYILMIWVLWLSSAAHAEIKARVDRNSIYLGESLTLTIKSDQNTNSQPDFTLLDAVFHVGQTGKSSSTQIINGQVNTETAWQVLLVPKSIGQHIIPPLEVDGEQTEVIKIEVKKPDPKAQAKGDIFIEIDPINNQISSSQASSRKALKTLWFSSGSAFDSADALLGSSIPTTSGVVIICAPEALASLMRSLTEAIFSSGSGVELVWIQAIFTTVIKSFFKTYYRSNIESNFPI